VISRRSFLKDILLCCSAPAIIRIERLMPIKPLVPVSAFLPVLADSRPFSRRALNLGTSDNPVKLTKDNALEYLVEYDRQALKIMLWNNYLVEYDNFLMQAGLGG
jgi:hypothetical protein